jgi:hypothetical protein
MKGDRFMVRTPLKQEAIPAARLTTEGVRSMAAGDPLCLKNTAIWEYRSIYMFKVWLRRRLRQVFATKVFTSHPPASWATPQRASAPVMLVESDIPAGMRGVTPWT